jgi:hypothetical protein
MPKSKNAALITISVYGRGIDIDAKIRTDPKFNVGEAIKALLERLATRSVEGSAEGDDFDIVQHVIKHSDAQVLQAIMDLARLELEARQAAS